MELQDSYSEISKNEIDTLCSDLEIQLPKDYVDFLLKHNGGQPTQNHFLKKDSNDEPLFDFNLNVFFGLGENDTSYDILTMFSIYCDRMPEELLPIGDDGVGNIICIGIHGAHYGKVFMWWKSGQVDEGDEPNFENVELIEDSFEKFVQGF